jgi:uncharacterized protein (DUF58 family)
MNHPQVTPRHRRGLVGALYRVYFLASGMGHFLTRRVRPSGLGLGLVMLLALCLMGQRGRATYQLFSLTVGMGLISLPWAFTRRAALTAKRELPRYATAGEKFRYSVSVTHLRPRKLQRAWLAESPTDPRPSFQDFTHLREPGEEERNAFDRSFAYYRWQWLMTGNRRFIGGSTPEDLNLGPREMKRLTLEITPLRRGLIHLDDLRVLLPDPFGLFQRCRKIKAPAATVTVLPLRYRLPAIEMPGAASYQVAGEANTNSIGNSGEFVGLRDYRPGDPLRQIHWRSWARTGRPIVKELEDTFYPRYGLVVDTLSIDQTDAQFEEVVSVAASFASSIDTNESLLDLLFIDTQAHLVTAGRGVERVEKLLEILATVAPQREENYTELAQLILRHRDDLTSCLVILNGWDPVRADFLKSLTRRGLQCVPIIIGKGPAPTNAPGHWLESGHIARDLLRLPAQLPAA